MKNYLKDVQYAIQNLIVVVWKEKIELDKLIINKKNLISNLNTNNKVLGFLTQNPDLDDEGIVNLAYWTTSHSVLPDLEQNEKLIINLKEEIKNKQYSIDLLSSTILQIAKQGLIRVYNNFESCPNGRIIKTLSLKDIIWHGRNQGIHFEQGQLHSQTETFFNSLLIQFPEKFVDFQNKNMSFNLLEILEWRTFDSFKKDMFSFDLIQN